MYPLNLKMILILLTVGSALLFLSNLIDMSDVSFKKNELPNKQSLTQNIPAELHDAVFVLNEPGYVYYHAIGLDEPVERTLSKELTTQLRKLVLDNASYALNYQKRTVFIPEFQFDFISPDGQASILFSNTAQKIKIIFAGKSAVLDIDPSIHLWADFISHIETEKEYLKVY